MPGAPLPVDDPTLLFVGAGMVPFKPYFSGLLPPPHNRMVSLQKCMRTTDIDAVGTSMRYNTFFQMAGSFIFGDFQRSEVISSAWDLLTRANGDGGLGMDPGRIWVTVLEDDDEAVGLWRRISDLPSERIQRLGREDNLWHMGVPGPCGPSSEIFFDRGQQYGPDGGPAVDTDRFMEMWNLVFMQDIRGPGEGEDYSILGPLPQRNLDTGMGLERTAVVLQEAGSVYETDVLRPILDQTSEISGRRYGKNRDDDVRLRIVADHTRSALMLIADGVTPATDGRGYVLRRLLRRTMRSIRLLGVDAPVLGDLVTVAHDVMSPFYPELTGEFPHIERIVRAEEDAFRSTLVAGSRIFDLASSQVRATGGTEFPGEQAFLLHDTYGFPIDLTLEISREAGLTVDEDGFRALMAAQRERGRSGRKTDHADTSVYSGFRQTFFTGYDELSTTAVVQGLVRDSSTVRSSSAGDIVDVMLDRTPFYAESGGQASDAGRITGDSVELDVIDVQKLPGGLWLHRVRVLTGEIVTGLPVLASVDPDWRLGARQAHSGTHIVHAALRQVLGPSALQSGSSNRPGHLRLDFAWSGALSDATRSEIEIVANLAVRQDLPVSVSHMSLDEATALGAIALFGEAYGDSVRVVEIGGPWSRELCGGTHVAGSAQVGPIAIVTESSVGSGVRRIEALVGIEAFRHLATERALVDQLATQLDVPAKELPRRIEELVDRLKTAQRQLARLRRERLARLSTQIVARSSGSLVTHELTEEMTPAELRSFAMDLANRVDSVVAIFAPSSGRIGFVIATSSSARSQGLSAHELVAMVGPSIEGKGGGTAEVAQGSGANLDGVPDAISALARLVS